MTGELACDEAGARLASEYAARYEVLRRHVVEHPSCAAGEGLVVVLRQGVAAWIDVWSKLPAPAHRPIEVHDERLRPSPLPDIASAEVVHVLAAMTLGHMQEVRA